MLDSDKQISNLRLYSLGIVVENKKPGSDTISVTPIEILNIQPSGDMNKPTKFKGTVKNSTSTGFNSEISSSNYLTANWLPFGCSNRISAPDVVANETVVLFKFADVDEYYWTTIFREPSLRRLETVLYGYSNLPSGMTSFDKSTSYWTEVDTKNKTVKLHTAMNDGELTEYDITIDTKKGTLLITDKKGNTILLNSASDALNISVNRVVNITAPETIVHGNLSVIGNISATGTIIDAGGNSNHHGH